MSYILDALKRSEQERRQVGSSNLSNDMMLIPRKRNKTQWWPFLLLAIFVLNIGAYVILNYKSDPVIGQEPGLISPSQNSDRSLSVQNKGRSNEGMSPNNYLGQKSIPSHVNTARQIKQQAVYPVNNSQVSKEKYRNTVQDTEYEGELIVPRKGSQSANLGSPSPSPYQLSSEEQERKKFTIHKDNEQVTVTVGQDPYNGNTANVDSASIDPFTAYSSLSELSVNFQRDIPSLIFNSHIYSDDPAARRVMINNIYLREGQRIEGMTLHAIGEFEILLEKNDELFTMPVLRDWQGV